MSESTIIFYDHAGKSLAAIRADAAKMESEGRPHDAGTLRGFVEYLERHFARGECAGTASVLMLEGE